MEDRIREQIKLQLLESGWNSEDILEDQSVCQDGKIFRIDMVLLYNLYPLAVIEIKSPLTSLKGATIQVNKYAEIVNVPFTFITNGNKIIDAKYMEENHKAYDRFPTPSELWSLLGREWNENDPRLFAPFRDSSMDLKLHHAQAISRSVESIVSGNKHVLISMIFGGGVNYVSFQIAWKFMHSGYFKRMILLSPGRALIDSTAKVFEPFGENLHLVREENVAINQRVHLDTTAHFLLPMSPKEAPFFERIPPDFYDLILLHDINNPAIAETILNYFQQAVIIGFSTSKYPPLKSTKIFGQPIFTYSLENSLATGYIKLPNGFRSVKLDEIAEIRSGVPTRKKELLEGEGRYLITGIDIQPDGTIDLSNTYKTNLEFLNIRSEPLLQDDDILISALSSGNKIRVGIVPQNLSNQTTFSTSLIRIRVDRNLADPKDVFKFLRSDVGQLVIRSVSTTSGATISRILIRSLSQIPIFLPRSQVIGNMTNELSASSRAKRQIKDDILPLLEEVEQKSGDQDEAENQYLEIVATKLQRLASTLIAPKLSERLMLDYPTPIALAYKRFHDARFNVYERVLRLRDVFEATGYYIYNIILADMFQNLDPTKYYIDDKRARKAYDNYSMSDRMDLIEKILETSKSDTGRDLFIPELANSSVVVLGKELQRDFRNKLSHTATATESQQQRVLAEFEPLVEEMLLDLEFLANYRLVRVTSFYYKQENLMRRTEVYHGIVPDIAEDDLPDHIKFTKADCDHLVLLNSEGQVLDLYPFYQLIASEETRYETHMCFFKQRRAQKRLLEGESVHGAFYVTLGGYDYFESLQSRILPTPPTPPPEE